MSYVLKGIGFARADITASVDITWQRTAGEWSTYNPLLMDEVAIVGTGDGEVLAVNVSDGSTVWSHPVGGMPRGLGVAGPVLYIGTLKGSVYALRYR